MRRTLIWLVVAAGGLTLVLVAVVVAAAAFLLRDGFDVPYQDAHQVQGVRADTECAGCLILRPSGDAAAEVTIRLTDTTRYDNHRSFPAGEPVTAWMPDIPNLDGTWDAIEVTHGMGGSRRGSH